MLQILLNGIIVGGIYALISVGFALIYSCVRFYHLAYGTIAVFGGYLSYFFQIHFSLNFFFSLFLASILSGFLGIVFWKVFYAPLQRKKCSAVAMIAASFGLLIVFQNIIALLFGNTTKSLALSAEIVPGYTFFSMTITFAQIVILLSTICLVVLFEIFLQKTKFGRAIRAVGQNKELALTVGINAEKVTTLVFFLATLLSVLGTGLIGLEIGLRPTHGFYLILKIIIACIIGGVGSVKGALCGGLLLGISENIGIAFFGAQWQDTVAFALLILFLLFWPRGLFSVSERAA